MNLELSKQLPNLPKGLAWKIGASGDGSAPVVTIRLVNPDCPSIFLAAKEHTIPAGTEANGILAHIAQQAREVLKSYERWRVMQTIDGTYDGSEDELAALEAQFREDTQ